MSEDLTRIVGGIGPKVRALRKQAGLSLSQLAAQSDVSAAAIHKIEMNGMVPTITTLLKVANALDRPVAYFVEEEQATSDPTVLTLKSEHRPIYTSHVGIDLAGISGSYSRFSLAGARATVVPGASSPSMCCASHASSDPGLGASPADGRSPAKRKKRVSRGSPVRSCRDAVRLAPSP